MGINAVIDTNVWISALLNPHGYLALLRASFEAGKFQAVISPPLLEELVDVLQRPRIKDKYRISPEDIEELVVLIEEKCKTVIIMGEMTICRDKDDNRVIETAVAGGAQYIVTRDDDLKRDEVVIDFLSRQGICVVTVGNFLQYLGISRDE
ncbi:MAG: putative toxin-antitoxin system toxin component, PIN family [Pseudomonadota bacterium]